MLLGDRPSVLLDLQFAQLHFRRVDLAGAVLQLLAWIEPDIDLFPWFEPPSAATVAQARLLLSQLMPRTSGVSRRWGK